jgi:hypothetical protein
MVLAFKSFCNSEILLPDLLVGYTGRTRFQECAEDGHGAHLVPLDDKGVLAAAEKARYHQKYSDLVPMWGRGATKLLRAGETLV